MANFFKNKLFRYSWLYFILLCLYTVFSYSLTAPNLTLTSWLPYLRFQAWMWETFFNNRELLTYTYFTLMSGVLITYVGLVKSWPKDKKLSWWLPLLIASPLIFSNNALSYDVFNYIFNAKMVAVYQANPHVQVALNFVGDNWIRFMHNTHTPAPYFYGWTGFSLLPYFLGGGKFFPTWVIFRLFSFLSLGLLSFSLVKNIKKQSQWLLWLLFNPLLLIEVVSNVHNDLWMMVPAVGAMLLVSNKKTSKNTLISLLLLLLSASIKLATIALLPLWLALVLPWKKAWPKLHRWVTKNWALLASLALFLPLLTPRSKQFLPWYLIWSLAWLPLINKKWQAWKISLVVLSISSMIRYLPHLWTGNYGGQVINQQLLITWLPFVLFWPIYLLRKKFSKINLGMIPISIALLYLITHLYQLTLLPVFADESIYIRWTQLIIDDWRQYLFFPMNDGKTPLMMWLMVPFQYLFSNQLFAGRFVAVLIGLGQIFSLGHLTKLLGGRNKTVWLSMLLGSVLPFWFFHHRMALTDALLVLGITWTTIATIYLVKSDKKWLWIGLTSLFLGLALWAKLPALLALPSLLLYSWLKPVKLDSRVRQVAYISIAIVGGLALFFSLRLHPVFPQLFARGSDFLYPWKEVVLQGKWKDTIINIPTYIKYFGAYLTWPVLLLNLAGQFLPDIKKRRVQHILLLSTLLFAGPIAILGKVVYPRYLLPVSLTITISAVLAFQELLKISKQKAWLKIILGLMLFSTIITSGKYVYFSLSDSSQTPFVSADKEQYLYKWSSGHGIQESIELIKRQAQNQTVAVATEGSFGTLPDGVLMYFHRQNVDNIYVEGIGFPVRELTPKFAAKAVGFEQILLIVNSHRLEIDLPQENLLEEYCRPDEAPCLQIWDITQEIKAAKIPIKKS